MPYLKRFFWVNKKTTSTSQYIGGMTQPEKMSNSAHKIRPTLPLREARRVLRGLL